MRPSESKAHIVIAGAGLTGLVFAALMLKRAGDQAVKISLVDQNPPPEMPEEYDARVVALTPKSQSFLQEIGVWDEISAERACSYSKMQVWDANGTGQIEFTAHEAGLSHLGHIVENQIVVVKLVEWLNQQPSVNFYWQDSIERWEEIDDQLDVALAGETLLADLLIAADGGRSSVRTQAGFSMSEKPYQQQAIVATIKTQHPHQDTAWQSFLETGPLALLPLEGGDSRYCSIVWSMDDEAVNHYKQLTSQAFAANLSRVFEQRLGEVQWVGERFAFPLKAQHASEYFIKNVVLLGDAAHTIHPLAGQGANLGLLDADTLSAELARAIKRGLALAEPSVLRRYQRQRKLSNQQMLWLMGGFKSLFGSRNPWCGWLRNQGLTISHAIKPMKRWFALQASGN